MFILLPGDPMISQSNLIDQYGQFMGIMMGIGNDVPGYVNRALFLLIIMGIHRFDAISRALVNRNVGNVPDRIWIS